MAHFLTWQQQTMSYRDPNPRSVLDISITSVTPYLCGWVIGLGHSSTVDREFNFSMKRSPNQYNRVETIFIFFPFLYRNCTAGYISGHYLLFDHFVCFFWREIMKKCFTFSGSNSFSAANLFLLIRQCRIVPTNYILQSVSEAQAKLRFSAAV